jgi:photosystem II stability/assembly factor-like uncharacterized protein
MKNSKLLFSVIFIFVLTLQVRAQWVKQSNGLPDSASWGTGFAIDAADKDNAVISFSNKAISTEFFPLLYKTSDGGASWNKITIPTISKNEVFNDVTMIDKMNIWVCSSGILYSSDGGINWEVQFYDSTKTISIVYIKMLDLNNGIAMGNAKDSKLPAIILKTIDGGKNWISVNDTAIGGQSFNAWRLLDFPSSRVGYFFPMGIAPRYLYKTTDGGSKWNSINSLPYIYDLKFYDDNTGIVSSTAEQNNRKYNKLYKTTDGCANWEIFDVPWTSVPVDYSGSSSWPSDIEFAKGNSLKIWMSDCLTLYYSSNGGKTWELQVSFPKNIRAMDIVFVDEVNGWTLTNYGVYHTTNGGKLLGVPKDFSAITDLQLYQNFPNPFNPETKIEYSISENSFVIIKIYNAFGQEVETLVNENQSAGTHRVNWLPKPATSGLPSGVYFYKLQVGKYCETKKMIYLR